MGNLGYALEHLLEDRLMALRGQKRADRLVFRCHRVPASGAMEGAKGDVVTHLDFLEGFGQFMFECKHRKDNRGEGKSFSVKKAECDKIVSEAYAADHVPAFVFRFKGGGEGTRAVLSRQGSNITWVALPLDVFIGLLAYARDLWDEVRREA